MPKDKSNHGRVALARALSKLGVLTRSAAITAVVDGRVTVSGQVVRDPGRAVSPERDAIAVDGQPARRAARRVLAMHKPRGYVTTRVDPQGRPTAYDLLPHDALGMQAIGRLDMATSGLLLFTNDTRLAHRLTDPASGIVRTYVLTVRGALDDTTAQRLVHAGIDDAGERLQARAIAIRKRSSRETHLIVELTEGRNRELRRLFAAVGHEVTRLTRVAFGRIVLGDLAPGQVRDVDPSEID